MPLVQRILHNVRSSNTTSKKAEPKRVIEVKLDLEQVGVALQTLIHSSMLLYFIERTTLVTSVKN